MQTCIGKVGSSSGRVNVTPDSLWTGAVHRTGHDDTAHVSRVFGTMLRLRRNRTFHIISGSPSLRKSRKVMSRFEPRTAFGIVGFANGSRSVTRLVSAARFRTGSLAFGRRWLDPLFIAESLKRARCRWFPFHQSPGMKTEHGPRGSAPSLRTFWEGYLQDIPASLRRAAGRRKPRRASGRSP